MECRRGGSLRLDARELDHLGPFLGIVGDELAEVSGRAGKHRPPKSASRALIVGIGKAGVDLLVELVDDLSGRVPAARRDRYQTTCLIARQEVAHVGMSGSASERVAVVTARARSLPALMCGSTQAWSEHDLHLPAE